MEALLGNELQTKTNGILPLSQVLEKKKVIGLYFSGHYCPPCRKFTPLLANLYDEIKEEGNDDFEIVFVSSDKEVEKFNLYYEEDMPWVALPYVYRDTQTKLREQFGVKFIPTLIFFNERGEVVEREGRRYIEENFTDQKKILEHLRQEDF